MSRVREPAVAGIFYPGDKAALRETLDDLFSSVTASVPQYVGRVLGCVAPHAGYMYSGVTAAHTYQALRTLDFETAILIGPSHRDRLHTNAVYDGDAFRTPLGDVAIDQDLTSELLRNTSVVASTELGHREEHALEVQLPFLQTIRPEAKILPITMGLQDSASCTALAECLARLRTERKVVYIASSDLSHYHPYEDAIRIDAGTAGLIREFRDDELLSALESERVEACGGGPVAVVMKLSKAAGATEARVLFTCNSGDVSGDRSRVVGYLSAVFGIPVS